MEWKELSNEAKSVIEWVENPFTDRKEDIEIQVGKHFQRDVPSYAEESSGKVDIPITEKLFMEIIKFVDYDSCLETVLFDANENRFVFKLREDIKLH